MIGFAVSALFLAMAALFAVVALWALCLALAMFCYLIAGVVMLAILAARVGFKAVAWVVRSAWRRVRAA